eukprot:TRINITY_DN5152_c0_g2_i1.p1 TRINITY_DN5152_c0_g2~~TRINITY_DN5152_c0_g2_i1.p1  ORF type:complete len:119 (-),score=7.06 TRINITY_DN5152_c0_g2_i1:520-876(-)
MKRDFIFFFFPPSSFSSSLGLARTAKSFPLFLSSYFIEGFSVWRVPKTGCMHFSFKVDMIKKKRNIRKDKKKKFSEGGGWRSAERLFPLSVRQFPADQRDDRRKCKLLTSLLGVTLVG